MAIKKIDGTPRFLLDTGLLFEINRTILHPLGLALEMVVDEEHDTVKFGKLWDCRNDPEGIIYTEETFKDGMEKFKEFMKEFGDAQLKIREETLGFIKQEDGDWGPIEPPSEDFKAALEEQMKK